MDPKSGDIKIVVDDFVEPNGLCFSPDEKKLYICDTGFTDGPDNPSHIRVFDVDVGAGKLSNGKVFADMPKPSITDGLRCDTAGRLWCSWVGAIRTRTACAATRLTAICSARSTYRKRSPTCASAVSNEIDFISAARHRSTQFTRVRRAL